MRGPPSWWWCGVMRAPTLRPPSTLAPSKASPVVPCVAPAQSRQRQRLERGASQITGPDTRRRGPAKNSPLRRHCGSVSRAGRGRQGALPQSNSEMFWIRGAWCFPRPAHGAPQRTRRGAWRSRCTTFYFKATAHGRWPAAIQLVRRTSSRSLAGCEGGVAGAGLRGRTAGGRRGRHTRPAVLRCGKPSPRRAASGGARGHQTGEGRRHREAVRPRPPYPPQ